MGRTAGGSIHSRRRSAVTDLGGRGGGRRKGKASQHQVGQVDAARKGVSECGQLLPVAGERERGGMGGRAVTQRILHQDGRVYTAPVVSYSYLVGIPT